jgi:hypothetical protein
MISIVSHAFFAIVCLRCSLEWDLFWLFSFLSCFESSAVGLYKFKAVRNQLKRTSLDALVCLPSVLIESANDGNPSPFVKVFLDDFGQFRECGHFDPAGLFLGRVESDIKGSHWISL